MSYEINVDDNGKISTKVEFNLQLTSEDVDDIVTSAFEGGINYWCNHVSICGEPLGDYASEHISKGGSVTLYDEVDDKEFTLDRDAVVRGVAEYIAHDGFEILEVSKVGRATVDSGLVDANVADSIVQYAIFGDIVYA